MREAIADRAKVELARRCADDFCERVIKDEKGRHIAQAHIHREMNWHIDECRRRGITKCGILAPWSHGKTENIIISRALQLIGEDVNNRIFIVSNSDDNAKARVSSIEKYIEQDQDYHAVHPHVMPGSKEEWSKHKLIVQRTSRSKDGSIEAWGITTSGTGSRCDYLLVDDPVDLRNAILNPALRSQVKDCFNNVWLSRLMPEGMLIYIATLWHNDDLTSDLLKNREFCFLIMRISEDFSCIECESPLKGKYTIPLWDQMWPRDRLISRRKEIGARAFDRGFRQKAMSDDEKTFPSSLRIFKYGVKVSDIVRPEYPRVAGIDPFGKFVVIFTIALGPGGKRIPIEVKRGKWGPKDTIQQIIDTYARHHHQIIVVENNAAQEAISQWAMEKSQLVLPILPFTTGAQKADPVMGLPGLEVEFSNDSWVVPMGAMHEPDCECGFCVWKKELDEHPVGAAADTVMASWFAREAARALELGILQPPRPQEETVTENDAGIERVKIGDY